MRRLLSIAAAALLLMAPAFGATPANGAQQTSHRRSPYVGAISADAKTGRVLFQDNADAEAYPASVTKLMTLLLVLEDIEAGKYNLTTRVTAGEEATRLSEPSWVDLRPGESMTVDALLTALMVKSANDAAVALGVHSAGSFDAFVARMNERAASLGMTRTRYYNPNGLPPMSKTSSGKLRRYPWKSFNVSTSADQLKLALELVKKPLVFRYTSQKVASVTDGRGQRLDFINHNNIMAKNRQKIVNPDGTEAVDGLKTGYIDAGGSSIVLTGKRGGSRAIVVVLGSSSAKERDESASRLLVDALEALNW